MSTATSTSSRLTSNTAVTSVDRSEGSCTPCSSQPDAAGPSGGREDDHDRAMRRSGDSVNTLSSSSSSLARYRIDSASSAQLDRNLRAMQHEQKLLVEAERIRLEEELQQLARATPIKSSQQVQPNRDTSPPAPSKSPKVSSTPSASPPPLSKPVDVAGQTLRRTSQEQSTGILNPASWVLSDDDAFYTPSEEYDDLSPQLAAFEARNRSPSPPHEPPHDSRRPHNHHSSQHTSTYKPSPPQISPTLDDGFDPSHSNSLRAIRSSSTTTNDNSTTNTSWVFPEEPPAPSLPRPDFPLRGDTPALFDDPFRIPHEFSKRPLGNRPYRIIEDKRKGTKMFLPGVHREDGEWAASADEGWAREMRSVTDRGINKGDRHGQYIGGVSHTILSPIASESAFLSSPASTILALDRDISVASSSNTLQSLRRAPSPLSEVYSSRQAPNDTSSPPQHLPAPETAAATTPTSSRSHRSVPSSIRSEIALIRSAEARTMEELPKGALERMQQCVVELQEWRAKEDLRLAGKAPVGTRPDLKELTRINEDFIEAAKVVRKRRVYGEIFKDKVDKLLVELETEEAKKLQARATRREERERKRALMTSSRPTIGQGDLSLDSFAAHDLSNSKSAEFRSSLRSKLPHAFDDLDEPNLMETLRNSVSRFRGIACPVRLSPDLPDLSTPAPDQADEKLIRSAISQEGGHTKEAPIAPLDTRSPYRIPTFPLPPSPSPPVARAEKHNVPLPDGGNEPPEPSEPSHHSSAPPSSASSRKSAPSSHRSKSNQPSPARAASDAREERKRRKYEFEQRQDQEREEALRRKWVKEEKGKFDQEKDRLRKLIASSTGEHYVLYMTKLAHLHLKTPVKEDQQQAINILKQVLDADPDHADLWSTLADLYLRDRMLTSSADCFAQACLNEPDNPAYQLRFAHACLRLDVPDYGHALDAFERVAELAQGTAAQVTALYGIGSIHRVAGTGPADWEKALDSYELAIKFQRERLRRAERSGVPLEPDGEGERSDIDVLLRGYEACTDEIRQATVTLDGPFRDAPPQLGQRATEPAELQRDLRDPSEEDTMEVGQHGDLHNAPHPSPRTRAPRRARVATTIDLDDGAPTYPTLSSRHQTHTELNPPQDEFPVNVATPHNRNPPTRSNMIDASVQTRPHRTREMGVQASIPRSAGSRAPGQAATGASRDPLTTAKASSYEQNNRRAHAHLEAAVELIKTLNASHTLAKAEHAAQQTERLRVQFEEIHKAMEAELIRGKERQGRLVQALQEVKAELTGLPERLVATANLVKRRPPMAPAPPPPTNPYKVVLEKMLRVMRINEEGDRAKQV